MDDTNRMVYAVDDAALMAAIERAAQRLVEKCNMLVPADPIGL